MSDNESVWCGLWPHNTFMAYNLGNNDLDFHGPVISFYILRNVSRMNVILWDDESVRGNVWPYNKYRSRWPIFHGLVILPYIFATVSCISYFGNIIWVGVGGLRQYNIISLILSRQSLGENGRSLRKTTWPPTNRTWLVSHIVGLGTNLKQWDDRVI